MNEPMECRTQADELGRAKKTKLRNMLSEADAECVPISHEKKFFKHFLQSKIQGEMGEWRLKRNSNLKDVWL